MKIEEYIAQFTSEVQADADSFQSSIEESFLIHLSDKLVESEVISDYKVGYFKKRGRGNKIIEINGYSYEDADGTFNFFVVDNLDDYESSLTNTDIDTLIRRAEELVYTSLEAKFLDWEESSPGYEAASEIYRLYQNREKLDIDIDLKKIKIFIFTNKVLSKTFKNIQREEIYDIPIEYSIYDATRLFEMAKAGFEKEPVDIDFFEYGIEGIEAISTTKKSGEFESYLASIPGKTLADIYINYGTQVLEGNVRAFLSVRGKVNKGIRKTILEDPEKFFVLNNGITVTGNGIESVQTEKGLCITTINDLQIVNGGQTTASLANAVIKEKADLSKVQVMVKLSILENKGVSEKLVPEISRASNSQNKVDEADFFSNHPYHIKFEELSKRNLAPAVEGNQYQTEWFYERARGQYTVAQMKLTKSQIKSWQLKHPKSQVIRKTDLAKFLMTYEGYPQDASKGAQAVMKKFSTIIQGKNGDDGIWANSSEDINSVYFKDAIAKAIIFKETEKLVSSLEWYKEVKAYRANIVAYTISVLAYHAERHKKSINLTKIWNQQKMYDELRNQCEITSKEVYNFLTREDRLTKNVTEWAKKEECWKRAKKMEWTIIDQHLNSLIEKEKIKKSEVNESTIDSMEFVINKDICVWQQMLKWGKKMLYLTKQEEVLLESAIKIHTHGKIPTDRQFSDILKVYNLLISKGFEDK